MKRILAIDGGGMKGIIAALWLHNEGISASDFDLIAGTSTGGLIALGIAKGLSPLEMANFYEERGHRIFKKRFPRKLWIFYRERYSAKPLEKEIRDIFGNSKLSDLTKDVLIPSANYNAYYRQHALFLFDRESPFQIFDAARATSAAPTYFPPHIIGNDAFIDGGLIANNPSDCAFAESRMKWGDEKLEILSVGTGFEPGDIRKVPRRPWKWLDDIISMGISGNVGKADTVLRNVAKGSANLKYTRIDFAMGRNVDMDDASLDTVKYLKKVSKNVLETKINGD